MCCEKPFTVTDIVWVASACTRFWVERTHLLDQAALFEFVAARQAADELTFLLPVKQRPAFTCTPRTIQLTLTEGLSRARCGIVRRVGRWRRARVGGWRCGGLDRLGRRHGRWGCSLAFIRLTIDLATIRDWSDRRAEGTYQKVAKDATRTPYETIRPPLDAALVFIEYKDCSALYHAPLTVNEPARNPRDHAAPGGFEHEKGVERCLNVPPERGVEHGRWGGHCCRLGHGRIVALRMLLHVSSLGVSCTRHDDGMDTGKADDAESGLQSIRYDDKLPESDSLRGKWTATKNGRDARASGLPLAIRSHPWV